MLRYSDVLPPDKAFYEAGMAARFGIFTALKKSLAFAPELQAIVIIFFINSMITSSTRRG